MSGAIKPSLFVDASAWISLLDKGEARHPAAAGVLAGLRDRSSTFGNLHTSVHTILEAYGWLLHHTTSTLARELLRRTQRGVHVHASDRDACWEAAARLTGRGLADVELADAVNAVLMDRHGIRTIWSYDRDYERLGYARVS